MSAAHQPPGSDAFPVPGRAAFTPTARELAPPAERSLDWVYDSDGEVARLEGRGVKRRAEAPPTGRAAFTPAARELTVPAAPAAPPAFVSYLGLGGFGVVSLVDDGGTPGALKQVSKQHLVQYALHENGELDRSCLRHLVRSMQHEVQLLQLVQGCPFFVQLRRSWQDADHLYVLMEPAMGGELWAFYERHELFGVTAYTAYYTAAVQRALEHLHERRVVYRDVKPQNVVLGADGVAKVCDFGLAKQLGASGRTATQVGSIEFWAPEIAAQERYGVAVDVWALGIFVYNLMTGDLPFAEDDDKVTKRLIKRGFPRTFAWPEELPAGPARDLVVALCAPEPRRRPGRAQVRQQPFLAHIAWDTFQTAQVPPLKPPVGQAQVDPEQARKMLVPLAAEHREPAKEWFADF